MQKTDLDNVLCKLMKRSYRALLAVLNVLRPAFPWREVFYSLQLAIQCLHPLPWNVQDAMHS